MWFKRQLIIAPLVFDRFLQCAGNITDFILIKIRNFSPQNNHSAASSTGRAIAGPGNAAKDAVYITQTLPKERIGDLLDEYRKAIRK
ncbi:hypothetical protein BDK51DRAFT_37077 [Blyttiomyces helicus]|uniref:Uncharacterized protein n=1 Tax=Blyttiomyces helicus TaxID=388810 RepID=A0A4P9W0T8_9FUNG|nr:hypothetical protein BDK51DRAFT_37077 [Blyttiomyces helicus]|eukprot:RKO84945.1 hypothetical protein BDK51DRAFT_37077 [Blyttiomyces helicus]